MIKGWILGFGSAMLLGWVVLIWIAYRMWNDS